MWHIIMVTFRFSVSKLFPLNCFYAHFMFFHSCIPHNMLNVKMPTVVVLVYD